MDWYTHVSLLPYFVSAATSLAIGFITWRRSGVPGTGPLLVFAFAQLGWTLFNIIEIIAATLEQKLFWEDMKWLLLTLLVLGWYNYAYIRYSPFRSPLVQILTSIPDIVLLGVILSGNLNDQMYTNVRLEAGIPFSAIDYDFTLQLIIVVLYHLSLILLGTYWLVRHLSNRGLLKQEQIVVIFTGFLVVLVGSNIPLLLDARLFNHYDVSPVAFVLCNLIVIWGAYQYDLFEVVPVARDVYIEHISEAVVVLDKHNRIMDVNLAAFALVNQSTYRTKQDIISTSIDTVFPQWSGKLNRLQINEPFRIEVVDPQTNSLVIQEISANNVYDGHNNAVGKLIIARDVTDQVVMHAQLEAQVEALEVAHKRYNDLVHSVPGFVFIFIFQKDGTSYFEFVSDQVREFLNVEPEALYGNPQIIYEMCLPEYLPTFQEAIQKSNQGLTLFSSEIPLTIKGEVKWMHFHGLPRRMEDGNIIWHGIGSDVTVRKEAEIAQQEAESRYRMLADLTFEAIVLHQNGIAVDVNRAFLEMFGYTREEVIGKNVVTLLATDEARSIMVEHSQKKHAGPYEVTGIKRSGTLVSMELETRQISENLRVAALRDISIRKETEERRIQLGIARQRTRLLAGFIEAAAHEFRTPLATIASSVYLLQRLDDPERKQKKVSQIEKSINDMTVLLDNLLEMMRLESRRTDTLKPVNMNDILRDCLELLAPKMQKNTQRLDFSLKENLPLMMGEPQELATAFNHILRNAMKFTPAGGTIAVSSYADDENIYVTIADSGVGMNEEEQQRLFEAFFRGDRARSTSGLGLGLSIARKAIEHHYGTITVQSRPKAGSLFRMSFPILSATKLLNSEGKLQ